jgi:molybdopterin-guanine dinucleotide biosynthesis protein A
MTSSVVPPSVDQAFLLVGRATRFPEKFLAPVEGQPILQRAADRIRAAGLTVSAVAVRPVSVPGLRVIEDRYDAGPLGGLMTIIQESEKPFFLFGGDMPSLDPPSIEWMRRRFDGRLLIPIGADGSWEVLHAVYANVPMSLAESLLRAGAGLRDLVRELDRRGEARFLDFGEIDPQSFTDVDTPAQYAHLVRSNQPPAALKEERGD